MNLSIVIGGIGLIMFAGCGNDSSSNITSPSNSSSLSSTSSFSSSMGQNSAPSTSKNITVVDGYINDAMIQDNENNVIGITHFGKVPLSTSKNIVYPLHAIGGYIDVNNDGNFEEDIDIEIPSYIELLTPKGYVISPLTTLVAMGADPIKLAHIAGIDPSLIYQDPIAINNITLEKLNQIAYTLLASKTADVFIYKVNNIGENDLPSFGGAQQNVLNGGIETFASFAMEVTTHNQVAMDLIAKVLDIEVNDPKEIEYFIKPLKENISPVTGGGSGGMTGGGSGGMTGGGSGGMTGGGSGGMTGGGSGGMTGGGSGVSSSISSVVSSSSWSYSSASSLDIPNFGNVSSFSSSYSQSPSDLPNFNGGSTSSSSVSSSSIISSSNNGNSNVTSNDLPSFNY